jgi:hypothetical protein
MIHPNFVSLLKELETIAGSFYIVAPERHVRDRSAESSYSWVWESYDPTEESQLSYSQLESSHRLLNYSNLSPKETIEQLSDKRLWPIATLVFCPDYFSSGDYGGSLVELSNLQTFLEDFKEKKGVWELYGSHGSSGLAIDIRALLDSELLEDLSALQSYPVRSEDHLSALELDKEQESWDSYLKSDFLRALERHLEQLSESAGFSDSQAELLTLALEQLPECELWPLCSELSESANIYWETEAINRYLDVERCAAELSLEDALDLLTPYLGAELGEIGAQLELSV